MRMLVVGGGGREHALAWKFSSDPSVTAIFAAPGNPGIARVAQIATCDVSDPQDVVRFMTRERIDLAVVGPEQPLGQGLVDRGLAAGLSIFGPTAAAAQLECSKVFAKDFMARHDIPTARYGVCDTSAAARTLVGSGEFGFPIVIKADGLAAGKGVVIAEDRSAAEAAITAAMDRRAFGAAGARIVIEECLTGPEVSFFVICDGRRAIRLASAQDHKRIHDGDRGPNTGGMGAFAPSPLMDEALAARVLRDIVEPVLSGMRAEGEGQEYRGFLYVGLMLTGDGPKVIEFNVRFGDPEAQVVLPLIDGELAPVLAAAAAGHLDRHYVRFKPEVRVGVVLASSGYPGPVTSGVPIAGLDAAERLDGVLVFHAGTVLKDDGLVTAGGRVLTVVGAGANYGDAIQRAYQAVNCISFEGMQYRRDIGAKALA